MLSDEMLDFLETSGNRSDEVMTLSVHTLCGIENPKCVRLQALIKDQAILQLLDSSSSNTFMSEIAFSRVEFVV